MTSHHPPSRLSRYLRWTAVALVLLIAGFALLFVSVDPDVGSRSRPTAANIAAAREAWRQLKATKGAAQAKRVRVRNDAIVGIAALANDATGFARFEGAIAGGVLSGRASVSLPLGLWINASVRVSGRHAGFPAYELKLGRVTFPEVASRWVADLARLAFRLKGATVFPLDTMVSHVEVHQQDVVADVILPADSGMIDHLISASAHPLSQPLVSDIYCRLAAAQRKAPVATLAQLVRRTFDPALAEDDEDFSRAAFVALSFIVVGEQAEPLAPEAAELARKCPHPPAGYVLQQRQDLAKHWAFSAGLTAVLGGETATSLGEWKELDDSLPNGSGFSFVDLAADRSGLQTALRALDPATAASTVAELAQVTEQDLLPSALLEGPEGLAERSFVDSFGSLDRARYLKAVESIDRTLTRQRSAGGGTR